MTSFFNFTIIKRTIFIESKNWKSIKNQRDFFDSFAKKNNILSTGDWYNVLSKDILKSGGHFINFLYKGNHILALQSIYPEIKWKPWRFQQVPEYFWKDLKNQRSFLEDFAKEKKFTNMEDWYNVDKDSLQEYGGFVLLRNYGNNIAKLVMTVFPEQLWMEWEFKYHQLSSGFWTKEKQILFLHNIEKRLNIQNIEDWYSIDDRIFIEKGGNRILNLYNGSLHSLLSNLYSNYKWKYWLFKRVPDGFWEIHFNVFSFLEWAHQRLGLSKNITWEDVPIEYIKYMGGAALLKKYGSISNIMKLQSIDLTNQYSFKSNISPDLTPDLTSDLTSNFSKKYRKAQNYLFKSICEVFNVQQNQIEIHMDYIHPLLFYSSSGNNMQLDIFIPSLKLGFEYQGKQHFEEVPTNTIEHRIVPSIESQVKRDIEKRKKCKEIGISLIEVPYTWDGSRDYLLSSIKDSRPELCTFISAK